MVFDLSIFALHEESKGLVESTLYRCDFYNVAPDSHGPLGMPVALVQASCQCFKKEMMM